MADIEYIRKQLRKRARERQLSKVARMSGVALSTLRRIINGRACSYGNAKVLHAFLTQHEQVKKLDENEAGE